MNRYLMFAQTHDGSEYSHIVVAEDDHHAIRYMDHFLRSLGIPDSEVNTVAGVWDRDPRFYTAERLVDLDQAD